MRIATPRSLGMLRNVQSYDFAESMSYKLDELKKQGHAVPAQDDEQFNDIVEEAVNLDIEHVGEIIEALSTGKYHGAGGKTIKDVLKMADYPKLFGAAAEIFIKNRIIPNRVVTENLFQTIPYTGISNQVVIRTFGGVKIEEVAEAGPYPETSSAVSDQAYRINLDIRKYGAKVAATRELMESDYWGILGYTLQQLGVEMENYKERLAVTTLNEMAGCVLKDNIDYTAAELGCTTGRGLDGAQNGALGVDDLMEMIAWMAMRGYNIDTFLVNPFAWALWARDTSIRDVVMGGGVVYVPQGSAAPGWDPMPWGSFGQPWSKYGSGTMTSPTGSMPVDPVFGRLGVSPYNWPTLTPFGATFNIQPKYIDRQVKVIVSPFVPFYKISSGTKANKFATNIIMADSAKCGLILEKEAPTLEEWKDVEREIDFIKIRSRFGMAMQEQGRGVCMAKNVILDRTYTFENINSRTLSDLNTSQNLLVL